MLTNNRWDCRVLVVSCFSLRANANLANLFILVQDAKLLRAPAGSLELEMLISDDEEEYHEGRYIWRGKRTGIPTVCRRPGSNNIERINNYILN